MGRRARGRRVERRRRDYAPAQRHGPVRTAKTWCERVWLAGRAGRPVGRSRPPQPGLCENQSGRLGRGPGWAVEARYLRPRRLVQAAGRRRRLAARGALEERPAAGPSAAWSSRGLRMRRCRRTRPAARGVTGARQVPLTAVVGDAETASASVALRCRVARRSRGGTLASDVLGGGGGCQGAQGGGRGRAGGGGAQEARPSSHRPQRALQPDQTCLTCAAEKVFLHLKLNLTALRFCHFSPRSYFMKRLSPVSCLHVLTDNGQSGSKLTKAAAAP